MSVVTLWRFDVYYLLLMCHIYMKVRMKLSASESLLPYFLKLLVSWDTPWHSWLRYCAISRKVAGSIPDGVRIFHRHDPSSRTMALGLTRPLTEMSIRNISWG